MKQLDFDRAFPQTPDYIHTAIEMGFRKGQKQMKMRNKIISMGSIAAAIAIMIAVAAFAAGGLGTPPQPDVLSQPVATDVPKAEEKMIRVYSTDGAAYYHLEPDCSGMENAVEMSEIEAVQMGKQACPVCIPISCNGHYGEEIELIYYSQGAKYFHKQEACGDGSFELMGDYFTVTRAFPAKEPCALCFPNGIEECVHGRAFVVEVQSTAAPAPEEYAEGNESSTDSMPEAEEYVPLDAGSKSEEAHFAVITLPALYYTPAGVYYHSDEHCIGMMNAQRHSREEARDSGKIGCPYCLNVYCTDGGRYFHLLSYCSGMQNAQLHSIEEAREMGKIRCDICMNPAMVYATSKGAYCHVDPECSGMQNAARGTLDEALIDHEKRICPVCMHDYSDYKEAFLPEHHELFVNAFGKGINELFPGCVFSFEHWETNDENKDVRVWMLHNSADPNEEAFAGVIEYAPGVGGHDGYRLRVNLTDNLSDGNHVNNAHDFLSDAYFWFGDIQVSLRNLCNYAQLGVNIDEIQMQEGMEHLLSIAGVMVYFDENEEVCGYDVRYYYNGTDAYILRTTIDTDGTLHWELLEGEVWK